MTSWVDLDRLSAPLERADHLSEINSSRDPYFFWKIILKYFKSKNDTKFFYTLNEPYMS